MLTEAYILEMPCVTLRENTGWVEDGWKVLVGGGDRPDRRGKAGDTPSGSVTDVPPGGRRDHRRI